MTEIFQPLQETDPVVVGGYRLAARLGAGGMGRVYLSHTEGGRPVAIKVVRPELADDPDFRKRFRREVRAARRVRGAYTAELLDADPDCAQPWLATLYVPGPSLSQAVARRGSLPVPALLWLMAGTAEALRAIHAEGIVHRDLKPSNVLLASDGPRVIDFGIALAADATAYTATGHPLGTPAYMAPEQASMQPITAATDVFALAQTAAFAALGRPLYGDGPGVDVLYRIVHSEPELAPLPEPLRPLFARCLAADPAERPAPAEIVDWCRQRLGAVAEADGVPAVWREIGGPESEVPPPVPEATPAQPEPPAGPATPGPAQDGRRARRRRAALVSAVGAVSALLAAVLAWQTVGPGGGDAHRDTAGTPAAPAAPSKDTDTGGATRKASPTPTPTPTPSPSPSEPLPEPYPMVMLSAQRSLNLADPDVPLTSGKGEVRFGCGTNGCALMSDASVFAQPSDKPGTTLDDCRQRFTYEKAHRLPTAVVANGSEICIKNPSGDIALFVIATKSTAVPASAFLLGDITVWRGAVERGSVEQGAL
ncbi:serine/threonine-protein kinase [Streptomyces sp. NBC_00525]|uniref:serine/threonine-protein kinase n=1 Tax=Streptomyces sp. NBC_00525 TaxID=2903660 RepID=UPI002E80C3FA|nr:serine/threonine-protein kinase [Streptomyces sp. NBC_00525]WUC93980.1 serine/threonine protein kinase [Streptomyces sp. NBC_00525]